MFLRYLFVLVPLSALAAPSPELELLGRIRQRMADNLDRLPDYSCVETIERTVRRSTDRAVLLSDRIRVEVAFIGRKETFALPGSGKFTYASIADMITSGAAGFGAFGAWTEAIFRSSSPAFTFAGESPLDGRHALRYDFRVPLLSSAYRLNVKGREAAVPYTGAVWIDAETLDVLRVSHRVEESGLDVSSVSETIRYARTRIGATEFLLPASSELSVADLEGREHQNLARFTGCRQYAAESTISFEAPPAAAPAAREDTPEVALPAGATLEVKLESPIAFEEAAVGDAVTARLDRAVAAGGVTVPKGAVLAGRIRRLEQVHQPEKYFVVGIEFSSMTFGGRRAAFQARLVGPPLQVRERRQSQFRHSAPEVVGMEVSGLDIDDSSFLPGVGVFRIWRDKLRLSRGMRMTWLTETRPSETKPAPAVAGAKVPAPVPVEVRPVAPPEPPSAETATGIAPNLPRPALPPAPEAAPLPVARVTTRLVEVHVVVSDSQGRPVSNLTRDDFTLLEGDEPQKIAHFSIEFGRTPPASVPSRPANVYSNADTAGVPRAATVILFDRLNTRAANQEFAKRQILEFLRSARPLELTALYVLDSRLQVLADFTGDRETIERALGKVHGLPSPELAASEPARPDQLSQRFKWVEQGLERADRSIAELAMEARPELTLRALDAIAQHLSHVSGRKNLIWISDSFPFAVGLDANELIARAARERFIPAVARDLSVRIARVARLLTDANVAVYPVEARGLTGAAGIDAASETPVFRRGQAGTPRQPMSRSPGPPPNWEPMERDTTLPLSVVQSQTTMQALAEDTGGIAFLGSNDLSGSIRRAFEDASAVYTLSYQPTHDRWDGTFRPIQVRVTPPGLNVRHRRGYFAWGDTEESEPQAERALREALWSPLEATGIGLAVALTPPETGGRGPWKLALTLVTQDLQLEPQGQEWAGMLDVLVVQRAADGNELAAIRSPAALRFRSSDYAPRLAEGIKLTKLLEVEPKAATLQVLVRDRRSGRLGSVRIPLERARAANAAGR